MSEYFVVDDLVRERIEQIIGPVLGEAVANIVASYSMNPDQPKVEYTLKFETELTKHGAVVITTGSCEIRRDDR